MPKARYTIILHIKVDLTKAALTGVKR